MIGSTKGAKRFISHFLSRTKDAKVFRKGRDTKHSQKRMLLYEVFPMLGTNVPVPGRKFDRMFVRRAVDKCPRRNKLKDPKIEASISGLQKHRAYSFLNSISQIMDDIELAL